MTLAEFKRLHNVTAINLYPSTLSKRLVGSIVTNKGERNVVTKVDFDSTQEIYVYPTDITDESTGAVSEVIVLSNKAPKAPTLVL